MVIINMATKRLFISGLVIIFTVAIIFAAYAPVSLAGKLITAPISKGGINRISAFPYHIKEIIGDKSKYELLSSDDGSNIFIIPKVKLGDKLELAVITSNGAIHDLLLTAGKDSVPAIHLNSSTPNYSRHLSQNKANEQSQILKMISHMSANHLNSYYVQNTNRNIANNLGLKLKQIKTWRFGKLVGAIIDVHNLSRSTKLLKENDFKSLFQRTKAISITGSNILPSQASSQVLIVTG